MILCVTLNPCLDKTLIVPAWRPGDSVRGRAVREVVGGKGNNVARALTRLGRSVRPATFLGGPVGAVVAGPRSVADTVAGAGLDKVVWCSAPDDVPAEASAPAVADAVAADPPRVVLAGRNPGERVLLGAVAARLKTAVLTGARSVASRITSKSPVPGSATNTDG